jgi:hypothetical protein
VPDIEAFISSLGLDKCVDVFAASDIDLIAPTLTEHDLVRVPHPRPKCTNVAHAIADRDLPSPCA